MLLLSFFMSYLKIYKNVLLLIYIHYLIYSICTPMTIAPYSMGLRQVQKLDTPVLGGMCFCLYIICSVAFPVPSLVIFPPANF